MSSARTTRLMGYATVAAMLPYLLIKLAWLAGGDVGVNDVDLMRSSAFVVANSVTVGMEFGGVVLVLAFTRPWGLRAPAWLVLFPIWVATGLLAPIIVGVPAGLLATALDGASAPDRASEQVLEGALQSWVYVMVYGGFILQGLGLGALFIRYLRVRWSRLLSTRTGDGVPGVTHTVQALAVVAAGLLVAVVAVIRCWWALGMDAGLPAATRDGRDAMAQVQDGVAALLAVAAVAGLAAMVHRRPAGARLWLPLTAAWTGAGAMFCWGAYQLLAGLLPGTPFDAGSLADAGGFYLVLVAQTLAGVLVGLAAAVHIVERAAAVAPVAPVALPARAGRMAQR